MPGLTVLLSFQRSVLVINKKNAPITIATALEVLAILLILLWTIRYLDMIGIIAASMALILGRLLANGYLFYPFFRVLKNPMN
jgi:hypothetical protein